MRVKRHLAAQVGQQRHGADGGKAERAPIRHGLGYGAQPYGAARASLVFHHGADAQALGKLVGQQPRRGIGHAAWRVGHDDANQARIRTRGERRGSKRQNSCAGQQAQTAAAVEGRHGNTGFYECECCAYCQPAGKALAMRIAIFGAGKQAKLAQANA